jgi:hypothetical protein
MQSIIPKNELYIRKLPPHPSLCAGVGTPSSSKRLNTTKWWSFRLCFYYPFLDFFFNSGEIKRGTKIEACFSHATNPREEIKTRSLRSDTPICNLKAQAVVGSKQKWHRHQCVPPVPHSPARPHLYTQRSAAAISQVSRPPSSWQAFPTGPALTQGPSYRTPQSQRGQWRQARAKWAEPGPEERSCISGLKVITWRLRVWTLGMYLN